MSVGCPAFDAPVKLFIETYGDNWHDNYFRNDLSARKELISSGAERRKARDKARSDSRPITTMG
jgi:hypothetical protein